VSDDGPLAASRAGYQHALRACIARHYRTSEASTDRLQFGTAVIRVNVAAGATSSTFGSSRCKAQPEEDSRAALWRAELLLAVPIELVALLSLDVAI